MICPLVPQQTRGTGDSEIGTTRSWEPEGVLFRYLTTFCQCPPVLGYRKFLSSGIIRSPTKIPEEPHFLAGTI